MNLRAGDAHQHWRETAAAAESAQAEYTRIRSRLTEHEAALAELSTRLGELRETNEHRRGAYMDQMRAAAALGNEISSLESQVAAAAESRQRGQRRVAEIDQLRQALDLELENLQQCQREIEKELAQCGRKLADAQNELAQQRNQHAAVVRELGELRLRHTATTERASLLDELEQRQEGLGDGVKEVLRLAKRATSGPLTRVHGVVAELFQVHVQTAPLIEVALGEVVGHLVVDSASQVAESLPQQSAQLTGRVSFISLSLPALAEQPPDLDGRRGVLGRADRFVETEAPFRPLVQRMLNRVWLVESLDHALRLAAELPEHVDRAISFVTLAGEKVTSDGTITIGPQRGGGGLLSRRSELRALRKQIAQCERRIAKAQRSKGSLEERIATDEKRLETLEAEQRDALERQVEHQQKQQAGSGRLADLDRQRQAFSEELRGAESRHTAATNDLTAAKQRLEECETALDEMERHIANTAREVIQLDQQRQELAQTTTAAKVEVAKSEERLDNLRGRLRQFESDQQERQRTIHEHQTQLAECDQRVRRSVRRTLSVESELALLYLEKERLCGQRAELVAAREDCRQRRSELAEETHAVRKRVRKLEEQIHAKDLAAGEIRQQRTTLSDRLRDDYGIEIAEVEADGEPSDEEQRRRGEIDQEIAELRRKINNIGNVNLEALEELDQLEKRFADLSSQYDDLAGAKNSLEQIINRINTDSRRMFSETLETVRGHFQTLFRKLFGGGAADIVLEEGVDVLESGIDIIAKPPGKELRSISLLSGGEKTMTCVALLLAMFRSRPSPFCVLDEVDAALDEANIGRFVGVLHEFLAWTQFIVVTHSKKTMTAANTLYGVTMQESGISKRVSVRFEDVSEDGEILNTSDDDEASVPSDDSEADDSEADDDETQAA